MTVFMHCSNVFTVNMWIHPADLLWEQGSMNGSIYVGRETQLKAAHGSNQIKSKFQHWKCSNFWETLCVSFSLRWTHSQFEDASLCTISISFQSASPLHFFPHLKSCTCAPKSWLEKQLPVKKKMAEESEICILQKIYPGKSGVSFPLLWLQNLAFFIYMTLKKSERFSGPIYKDWGQREKAKYSIAIFPQHCLQSWPATI